MLSSIKTGSGSTYDEQNYTYAWDDVGNLTSRKDNNQSALEETFQHDELNRLTQVDLSTESNPTMVLTYYANGNIKTKSDVTDAAADPPGVYGYGQGGGMPHVLTDISAAVTDYNHYTSFHYDPNGNMDCRGGTTAGCSGGDPVTWYAFNKPEKITDGADSAAFVYGPDRARVQQTRVTGSATQTIYYAGSLFEKEFEGITTRWRLNIYAYGELIYWINEHYVADPCTPSSGEDSYFVLKDHLGSVDYLLRDGSSGSDLQYSYDAFGLRRDVTGWADDDDYSQLTVNEPINRGYTEHEHLDNVRLIHMNGRVQDPIVGRMLSVDPIVGSASRQSHNGYSYVGNSPLRLTDPTGFTDSDSGLPPCVVVGRFKFPLEIHSSQIGIIGAANGEAKLLMNILYAREETENVDLNMDGDIGNPNGAMYRTGQAERDRDNGAEEESQADHGPSIGGFIREEGLNVVLRTATVVGGGGQVLLGGALCSTAAGCLLGGPVIALGASNIQEGFSGEDGFAREGFQAVLGENSGDLAFGVVNLGTSVGGLARPVLKATPKDGVRLFRNSVDDFEPAINQATNTGLAVEGAVSVIGIYDTLQRTGD